MFSDQNRQDNDNKKRLQKVFEIVILELNSFDLFSFVLILFEHHDLFVSYIIFLNLNRFR